MRKNLKTQNVSMENSIKKSNELSMAKLNHGLTLNQMQLLAFAIFSTQQNGATEFHKSDFEKKFELTKYNTVDARKDASKLSHLQFSIEDLENDYFEYWNFFRGIRYKEGLFTFRWTEELIPHILELKEKYITTDLTITANFKSGFSWMLYDFLKAHYGYWHKPLSKESLMKLFGVEGKKTYVENTNRFKKTVLDVAIAEINEYTELDVRYKEEKKGRTIVGFDLIWSNGKTVVGATKKQINELTAILDVIFEDVFKFVNLKDDDNREQAIEIVRAMELLRNYTELPICITKEKADTSIQQANWNLRELNRFLEEDGKEKMPLYNWLEA
ncbi:replication initiation protein [Peribacillus loiseleuriae]|uniref:replication initiation protein n=1 Tax=Peribacillus loiseleuriae TaxID=1679170 RepID=UPI00381AA7AE